MTGRRQAQREAPGALIRQQRQRVGLSLRQLAEHTSLSNPYLSQVEQGPAPAVGAGTQGDLRRA